MKRERPAAGRHSYEAGGAEIGHLYLEHQAQWSFEAVWMSLKTMGDKVFRPKRTFFSRKTRFHGAMKVRKLVKIEVCFHEK